MKVRATGTALYKGKLTFLFLLIGIVAILSPLATSWGLKGIVRDIKQIRVDSPVEETALGISANAKSYQTNANEITKLLENLRGVIYAQRNLQGTLAEEILDSGLLVDSFAVNSVSEATEGMEVPNESGGNWENFNFASVSLTANLKVENLSRFMMFLATRSNLWHITALDMQPLDTPAEFVTRFQTIETDITAQGRVFEKDSLLETINKRPNKNILKISMNFIVPVAARDEVGLS